ncbi:hypothetical protein PROFUN_05561 [Planoprotostelium fungivorum]|uniref:Uncharacterized protein n=1 Tax=Planoprotostelium fungivorum TaxID=1890364 RepID=A0A2P6N037_9EUKA|nr:hypothetical protein PROFUN_05561 [Planoprotostelium fungivorum]
MRILASPLALMAQSVARSAVNRKVPGSSPEFNRHDHMQQKRLSDHPPDEVLLYKRLGASKFVQKR